MSILIKGMEMPKHCGECGIEWCDRWKKLIVAGMSIAKSRPSDCPLVPVPEHGRLIDADALMEIISKVIGINASIDQRNEATDQERRCLWWFEEQVNIAPTIIPAEEGE